MKNIVHPKKDLIFALNFGGSQGEIFARLVVGIYDMYMDNPIWLMPIL